MHKRHNGRGKRGSILKHDLEKLREILAVTAHDVGGHAKHAITDSFENVRDKSVDLQESVVDYVNHKPFKALGIAVLSGLILGMTMRKKRRYYRE